MVKLFLDLQDGLGWIRKVGWMLMRHLVLEYGDLEMDEMRKEGKLVEGGIRVNRREKVRDIERDEMNATSSLTSDDEGLDSSILELSTSTDEASSRPEVQKYILLKHTYITSARDFKI